MHEFDLNKKRIRRKYLNKSNSNAVTEECVVNMKVMWFVLLLCEKEYESYGVGG